MSHDINVDTAIRAAHDKATSGPDSINVHVFKRVLSEHGYAVVPEGWQPPPAAPPAVVRPGGHA